VIWPAALVGCVAGAAAGFLAAPDVIALPGLLALSGLALGLLMGLTIGWSRASEPVQPAPAAQRAPAAERAPAADRHVADAPGRWPPPAQGDLAPGWYADPRDSGARRYWDGESWTQHLWRDRQGPGPRASASSEGPADEVTR
jgi:hypothetical protein